MSPSYRPVVSASLFVTVLAVTSGLGCASSYTSYYKETNSSLRSKPVRPERVEVARSRDDVQDLEWVEVGLYRGKAPTVTEAMDAAKRTCGSKGADFYILNTEPFFEDGGYRVHGICAVSQRR